MSKFRTLTCLVLSFLLNSPLGRTQSWQPAVVDPTLDATTAVAQSKTHTPLPEEYVWTSDVANPAQPRFLRCTFTLETIPGQATLYVAGPRAAVVFVNGQRVGDFIADRNEVGSNPPVYIVNVSNYLRSGRNLVALSAIAAVKTATWEPNVVTTKGAIVAKIVPAAAFVNRPALFMSSEEWKATTNETSGWELPGFDDSSWPAAKIMGAIESNIDFFQWNADSGLYRWPGYDGISPFLIHIPVPAVSVQAVHPGAGKFEGLGSISSQTQGPFSVQLPKAIADANSAPSFVLDFGREINGRLRIVSDSSKSAHLMIQLGESYEEALKKPFLGSRELIAPPGQDVFGPKNAFRYARIRFLGDADEVRIRSLGVDGIYYPVTYQAAFESSDPLLNRIWQVGAYTAHLCMQDDIWDAPKRDRGRYMGDLHVTGNVVNHVFADHFPMEDTLNRLNPSPVTSQVNGIPGYSADWVIGQADYYRQFGSKTYLHSVLPNLTGLLTYMERDLDENNLFVNKNKNWPFVDWSQGLQGDTAEARRATHFQYFKAFQEGAFLLREASDPANAERYELLAVKLKKAAYRTLLDHSTKTFGPRWQSNAFAVYSGIADAEQMSGIQNTIFSALDQEHLPDYDISPYNYNYFLYAMSKTGDRSGALTWIRKYWGGMIAEGATSFWEGYDTRWPKQDFHASLHADDGQGYYVSLAHGWASGPTAWLMDNIFGITPSEPGFRRISIRPDLLDLSYAKGTVPTPHGPIRIDIEKASDNITITLDLPEETISDLSVPVSRATAQILINDQPRETESAENGARRLLQLGPGHYVITSR